MRDLNRIPKVLEALRTYWEQNPDLRLGQIVVNANQIIKGWEHTDAYYLEDEELLKQLEADNGAGTCLPLHTER